MCVRPYVWDVDGGIVRDMPASRRRSETFVDVTLPGNDNDTLLRILEHCFPSQPSGAEAFSIRITFSRGYTILRLFVPLAKDYSNLVAYLESLQQYFDLKYDAAMRGCFTYHDDDPTEFTEEEQSNG